MRSKGSAWERLRREASQGNENAVEALTRFEKFNNSIGGALVELSEQPQDIQGREREMELLAAVLERPRTPVALLLAPAGAGKTSLVEEFTKRVNNGVFHMSIERSYMPIALRIGRLASLGVSKLQSTLSHIFDTLAGFEEVTRYVLGDDSIRVVLFIDEVHMIVTIFGAGTKIGGDVVKDVLARSPIRIIAATTRREYDSTIAVDKPLAERFKQIELAEVSPATVETIAENWWGKVAPDCPYPGSEVVRRLIEANRVYRSDSAEPRKSLDILEDLVSYSRRTGRRAGMSELERVFKDRYSISLSFNVDADTVFNQVSNVIKGQSYALYELKRALRGMVFQLDPTSNRPKMTALMCGSSGTGKTETVKQVANGLYHDEEVLLNINMPDYKTAEHEPAFRKRLGEHVRHSPNAVVLLDELEKAHPSVLDSLLAILDEGQVTFEVLNREGLPEVNTVSLRNSIVFATTNEGSEVFDNDAKFSQREARGGSDALDMVSKAEAEALNIALYDYLLNAGFRAELLGRFQHVLAYRSLSSQTILSITERELDALAEKFQKAHGITFIYNTPKQWPPEVYDFHTTDLALYITFIKANVTDANAGGARAVMREIRSSVYSTMVDGILENPGSTRFKVYVSNDAPIYQYGASRSEGGVIVEPY